MTFLFAHFFSRPWRAMTCFLVHHHPRQGGVGAVAALGTAAGRGKSGPRSSALQRTSEVRLGTPCRGAAQSQNRGDFAEQRSQGEAALVGHFVFLFFFLGWFWDGFGVGGDFFFWIWKRSFKRVRQHQIFRCRLRRQQPPSLPFQWQQHHHDEIRALLPKSPSQAVAVEWFEDFCGCPP